MTHGRCSESIADLPPQRFAFCFCLDSLTYLRPCDSLLFAVVLKRASRWSSCIKALAKVNKNPPRPYRAWHIDVMLSIAYSQVWLDIFSLAFLPLPLCCSTSFPLISPLPFLSRGHPHPHHPHPRHRRGARNNQSSSWKRQQRRRRRQSQISSSTPPRHAIARGTTLLQPTPSTLHSRTVGWQNQRPTPCFGSP